MSVCPSRETLAIIDGWLLTHNVFAVTLAMTAVLLALTFLAGKGKNSSFWYLSLTTPVVLFLLQVQCDSRFYGWVLVRDPGAFLSTFLLLPAFYIFPPVFVLRLCRVIAGRGTHSNIEIKDYVFLSLLILIWLYTRMTLTMDG